MSLFRSYPAGIPIQTRRQAGKKLPLREAWHGELMPEPTVIMGVTGMRWANTNQHVNASLTASESQSWRDGTIYRANRCRQADNDTWRRAA